MVLWHWDRKQKGIHFPFMDPQDKQRKREAGRNWISGDPRKLLERIWIRSMQGPHSRGREQSQPRKRRLIASLFFPTFAHVCCLWAHCVPRGRLWSAGALLYSGEKVTRALRVLLLPLSTDHSHPAYDLGLLLLSPGALEKSQGRTLITLASQASCILSLEPFLPALSLIAQ